MAYVGLVSKGIQRGDCGRAENKERNNGYSNTPPLTRHNGDLAMTATQADWKDTPFNKPFNMMEESSRFHKWLAAGSGLLFSP